MSLRCLLALASTTGLLAQAPPVRPTSVAPLTPSEQLRTFDLPPGYRIELVAAEPLVVEPACCAFDGDGNLWVAELRTYMQDIDGTGTDEPRGIVARLRDTDADGRLDERVEFATGLVLPRLLLPLDAHRVLIQQTYDGVLWCYHDDDGDGVSDGREVWYRYPQSRANLEHQDSALVWGIDNWLYTAMGGRRHRITARGLVATEEIAHEFAQWGLATDDLGRQFFSSAGGERPAFGFQQHPVYGKVDVAGTLEPGFEQVWPRLALPDVQGGTARLRGDGTLNHFTGCCGQVVFRGDRLPELYGDYLIAEPVGRLIRRAVIGVVEGKRVLRNAYERTEFVTSTDPNFRPVWLANAPDGCLWVVDMYRGIIQEGNWVREGSYLRPVVEELGLAANVGRGRIWRIVHEDHPPSPVAHLHGAPLVALIAHLSHENGFWRDTAQRLLVLRGDADAVPALTALAQDAASPPLARVHALWTLDGLGATELALLRRAFRDRDARVRATAVRIAEGLAAAHRDVLLGELRALAADPEIDVRIQVLQSLRFVPGEAARELAFDIVLAHADNELVRAIGTTTLRQGAGEDDATFEEFRGEDLALYRAGRDAYRTTCIACHGPDGRGVEASGLRLAPSLAGSRRLCGSPDAAVRILLHGMTGPIDDVVYPGNLMAPMGQNDDAFLAGVLTYARNAFGNAAPPIRPETVAHVRRESEGRTTPFTIAEIDAFQPVEQSVVRTFRLTASHGAGSCAEAVDGDLATRFTTGTPMRPGMWFQIEFPVPWTVERLVLDARRSPGDYPRGYEVRLSDDGEAFGPPVVTGEGDGPVTTLELTKPCAARFLRIVQTGATDGLWWSIHELELQGRPAAARHE